MACLEGVPLLYTLRNLPLVLGHARCYRQVGLLTWHSLRGS